jgi:WD40 repeat protein/tRNA A-37 threonylcarbamoyl transferase component Bud32
MTQHSSTSPACGDPVGAPPGAVRANDAATLAAAAAPAGGAEPAPAQVAGYDILGELGRGGMGVVYKARQHTPSRVVALKMILAAEHAGAAAVARFRNEAEAVARLQHPNIVQVHEVGEHQGRPFFTLEYVDGGGLDKRLAGTPQPPRQAAQLVETLARAIEAAHAAGVIHRDLKPANVLLTAAGEPKLTDFGLAKQLGSLHGQTESGAILGTPSYMAPEQAAGKIKEIGPATDVYALGAILYECLTGRPPFKAATPVDTILQVIDSEPVPPTRLQPQVPRDLETICLKCLEKVPARRYASAAALADDLRRYLAGEPIAARPVGGGERLAKWARRRPAVAALSAAVVAVTAVAFVLVTAAFIQMDEKRREAEDGQAQLRIAERAAQAKAEEALKAQKATLYGNYRNNISLAHQLWLANNVTRAREVLADCPPEHRNWEWRYLDRVTRAERYTVPGDGKAVATLAFSPDGRLLVVGEIGAPDQVQVRDAATGKVLLTLPGAVPHTATFSPDGKRLAWVGREVVEVLRVDPGQPAAQWPRQSYKVNATAAALCFTPAGQLLAAEPLATGENLHGRTDVRVLDVETDREVCRFDGFPRQVGVVFAGTTAPVFSPDGARLALVTFDTGGRGIPARPTVTEKPLKGKQPDGDKQPNDNAANNPPQDFFPGQLKVWDLTQKRLERTFDVRFPTEHTQVAFSPDGKRVAWGDGALLRVAELADRQEPRTLGGRQQEVRGVAFSPDGSLVAAGGEDGTIVLWGAAGTEEVVLRGHTGAAARLAFSADGKRLASGSGSAFTRAEVKCWDLEGGAVARPLRGPQDQITLCLALHADSGRFVEFSANGPQAEKPWSRLTLRDLVTNQPTMRLPVDVRAFPDAAFRPDGKQLALGGATAATLLDAQTGRETAKIPLPQPKNSAYPYALAYDPAGNRLALGVAQPVPDVKQEAELVVSLVESDTGHPVRTLRDRFPVNPEQRQTLSLVRKMAFGPGGRRLAAAVGVLGLGKGGVVAMATEVLVWDTESGQHAAAFSVPYLVHDMAFTPDGRLVLAGGSMTAAFVELWDVEKRAAVTRFEGHSRPVYALALSPDGSRLATGGGDRTVKVWDTATGQELLTLVGHAKAVTVVAFGGAGRRLLTGTGMEFTDMFATGAVARAHVPMEVRVWDAGE